MKCDPVAGASKKLTCTLDIPAMPDYNVFQQHDAVAAPRGVRGQERKMFAIDRFSNSIEEVVAAINAAKNGQPVPYFGGTYTGSAETLAAEYAVRALEEVSLKEVEAHLDFLHDAGAFFSFEEAGEIARNKLMQKLLEEARQELGEDAITAQVVARAAGEDGMRFKVVEGGDFLDTILIHDLAEAAGAKRECARRHWFAVNACTVDYELEPVPCSRIDSNTAIRYVFPDDSAIVIIGDGWDIEGDKPFSWARA